MPRTVIADIPFDDVDPILILSSFDFSRIKQPFIATGIHITTINALTLGEIKTSELNEADLIYADGISVQITMQLGGLKNFRRISTTDLISRVFFEGVCSKPLRVAFLGGTREVSDLARLKWCEKRHFDLIWNHHGFESCWDAVLDDLKNFDPQLILIGFGMPLELKFLIEHRHRLPNALILTCGGYLRLLAGTEKRAPSLLQALRLEWLYRLVTNPKQTYRRYLLGFLNLRKYAYRAWERK